MRQYSSKIFRKATEQIPHASGMRSARLRNPFHLPAEYCFDTVFLKSLCGGPKIVRMELCIPIIIVYSTKPLFLKVYTLRLIYS